MMTRSRSTACNDFEKDLVVYYYKESSPHEHRRVESHLQSCGKCRGFLRELADLLPLTRAEDRPPAAFWESYSNELRRRLGGEKSSVFWWNPLSPWSVRWPVPATAAGLVVGLALTLTLATWKDNAQDLPPGNQAVLEVLPVAESFDFFNTMDVLDVLDLLESPGGPANGLA